MSRFLKEVFFRLVPEKRLPESRASILMYHSVGATDRYFSSVLPGTFEKQMAYLAMRHIPVIPLAELVRRFRAGEALGGAVALTFDDGYEDNYTNAFPLLKRFGFPATIFVTTGLIGGQDARDLRRLSAEHMIEMASSGLVSFEPHTESHPHLTALPDGALQNEIAGSKRALEAVLHRECRLFAYPYGNHDGRIIAALEKNGFDAACSVSEGTVSAASDRFSLPRNSIDRSTSFVQFRGKVSLAIDSYQGLKKRLSLSV